jgi:type II secretory pathway pseudopilin PulG
LEPGLRGPDRTDGKDATRAKPVQGLTLIELGIVMLLMAILASFSIPRLLMITEINLRTSARHLAETLQLIASMATNTSRPYAVQYDMDKGKYCYTAAQFDAATARWVARFADDSTEVLETDTLAKTKCFDLKGGVYFREIETLTGIEKKQEKGKLSHWYSPRGITDPLLIRLGDKQGRFYTLILSPYGGGVEVRKGTLDFKEYYEGLLE